MTVNTGDPTGSACKLQEAARQLAQSTCSLERPFDSYTVLGDLTDAARSIQQAAHQLARWHRGTHPQIDYTGGHDESTTGVLAAATALDEAAELVQETEKALSRAHTANGTIRWFDGTERDHG
jgi:hypothetical protein